MWHDNLTNTLTVNKIPFKVERDEDSNEDLIIFKIKELDLLSLFELELIEEDSISAIYENNEFDVFSYSRLTTEVTVTQWQS